MKRLFKSTSVFAFWTLLSRVLGLVREMVFARFFGANAAMDAFLVAFKIPNFLRRLFAEGAFTQAFVPLLAKVRAEQDDTALKIFVGQVAGTLALIVLVVSVIGSLCSPILIGVFAPGFWHDPSKFSEASAMLRITFPYLFFITLTALCSAVLNTFGRFAIPAMAPIGLNVCLIAFSVLLSPYFQHPVYACALGVLVAGVLQLGFLVPFVIRLGVFSRPKWSWRDAAVKRLLRLMVPALLGASVAQISLLIDTFFASWLPSGSVSWLYYADRLMQFPLGVFGVALSTVALPHLSSAFAKGDQVGFNAGLAWALRWVLRIAMPAAVGLMVLSGPLLTTLLNYGRFNHHDVLMAQQCLIAFSMGLLCFIAVKVLVSAYYAQHNMRTPAKIALWVLLANIIFNAVLIGPLAHAGLALATTLAGLLNVSCLLFGAYRAGWVRWQGKSYLFALRVIFSTLAMATTLVKTSPALSHWQHWHGLERLLVLLALVFLGMAVYFGCLWLLGDRFDHQRQNAQAA